MFCHHEVGCYEYNKTELICEDCHIEREAKKMRNLEEYKNALEDMVWQFASRSVRNNQLTLWTGGLSALEHAFEVLGWENVYFLTGEEMKELQCNAKDCYQWATCGTPTETGYKHFCGTHFRQSEKEKSNVN